MRLSEAVTLALGSMKTGKMRSLLTLLGIIIGIGSVITILTLGHALKTQTLGSLNSLGINNLTVSVESRDKEEQDPWEMMPVVDDPDALISKPQLEQLRARFDRQVAGVSYSGNAGGMGDVETLSGTTTLKTGTASSGLSLVSADYLSMSGAKIAAGRDLTEQDVEDSRPVAVISSKILTEVFGGDQERALGSEIRFTNTAGAASFLVIGITEDRKGGLLIGDLSESRVYVPYSLQPLFTSHNDKTIPFESFQSVDLKVAAGTDKAAVQRELQSYFDATYRENQDYQVKVKDNQRDMDAINKVLDSISAAVAAIGGISLLVGGIGVMNVMLITVTERTREIGVRKALGARRKDIKLQFIVEAMIVCLIGGLIGVALGTIFGMIGANMLGQFVFPPASAVLISLLFCMGIGLFFGYYPAAKAAKLNPIEALRYE